MKPEIVFGPPGTGKTTHLMKLLEKELETVPPHQIAYVSFTKKGAEQGIERAMQKFGYGKDSFPYFRTLHSMAFNELRMKRASVISQRNYKEFSEKLGMYFTGYYTEDLHHDDDMYLFFDELFRNNPKYAANYLSILDSEKLIYVRKNYAAYKEYYGIYDFTDMVDLFCKRNKSVPVRVAFIDEAQDLTTLQWRMVWTAFQNCERVYIAGDDDQAIYQWSGADVEYFLGIEGNTTILRQSYRLPDSILEYAKNISSQISKRVEKDYHGTGGQGSVIKHNSVDEIKLVDGESYMFLSRNNKFLGMAEDFLMRNTKMYRKKGKLSVSETEVSAIRKFESARKEKNISEEARIALRGILKDRVDFSRPWYENFKWKAEKCNYIRDLVMKREDMKTANIDVGTIHSVKGGEADNVVLFLDISKNVQLNLDRNPDSEHRAFYVGATRARKRLHIVYESTDYGYPIYERL